MYIDRYYNAGKNMLLLGRKNICDIDADTSFRLEVIDFWKDRETGNIVNVDHNGRASFWVIISKKLAKNMIKVGMVVKQVDEKYITKVRIPIYKYGSNSDINLLVERMYCDIHNDDAAILNLFDNCALKITELNVVISPVISGKTNISLLYLKNIFIDFDGNVDDFNEIAIKYKGDN